MSTKEDKELQMELAVLVGQGTELTFYDTKMLIRLIKSYATQRALEELENLPMVARGIQWNDKTHNVVMDFTIKDRITALKKDLTE